ncbi:MAG: transcription antitermination factor NusB [Eubacterium sp.]|nr:transcription antitermination factor NusB [Eubacterium sp.]
MTRTKLRENIFLMLFRKDFYDDEALKEQLKLFDEEIKGASEEDHEYICKKASEIIEKADEIDKQIDEKADKWSTSRMGKVELTILRLAYYEMKYDDDVPVSVAINEAVELAKKFGGDTSSSFVNGVLAKLTDEE